MAARPRWNLSRAGALALIQVCLISGCERAVIEGVVVDVYSGKPIPDVEVGVEATEYSATTDRNGRYSLRYSPGSFFIIFQKDGYFRAMGDYNLPTESRVPADTVRLRRRPPGAGVYLIDRESGEHKPLEQGTMCDQEWSERVSATYWRTGNRYLIDVEPATRNVAPPGEVTFVQYAIEELAPSEIGLGTTAKTRGLELVAVEDSGYVLIRHTSFGRVLRDATYKRAPVSERVLSDSLILTTYDLGHGTYALLSTRQRIPILGYPFTVGTPNNRPTSICKGDVM